MLNLNIKEEILSLRSYLSALRDEMNAADLRLQTNQEKKAYLLSRKMDVFENLDRYFDSLWAKLVVLSEENLKEHKSYMEDQLLSFFADGVEMNEYIRKKPLGYAGDYLMMEYIYNYHGESSFFGKDLYAKMLNHYTCNVDVASSNIQRKEYLKRKILSFIEEGGGEILSVGCGPAREWVELLKENKIVRPLRVHLLDLEKNAIEFVRNELDKINYDRSQISVNFYMQDLLEIVKNKKMVQTFQNVGCVYVSGVFDYLNDKLSRRVIAGLLKITKQELIVFNMSEENDRHRAYYEVLGEWVMFHRTRDQILDWVKGLEGVVANLEDFSLCKSYWILRLRKK